MLPRRERGCLLAQLCDHAIDGGREPRKFVRRNGIGRREVDDRAKRADKNSFFNKALAQGVKIIDAVEFDHPNGAVDPHVLDTGKRPARLKILASAPRDFGDLIEPRFALEQVERGIGGGAGERDWP